MSVCAWGRIFMWGHSQSLIPCVPFQNLIVEYLLISFWTPAISDGLCRSMIIVHLLKWPFNDGYLSNLNVSQIFTHNPIPWWSPPGSPQGLLPVSNTQHCYWHLYVFWYISIELWSLFIEACYARPFRIFSKDVFMVCVHMLHLVIT